jgi:hypothetical protein
MRRAAFEISRDFTDAGATEWLFESLAREKPADERYENLRRRLDAA